jgi:hypothetical protein
LQTRSASPRSSFEHAHPDPRHSALIAQPGGDFVARDKYILFSSLERTAPTLRAPLRSVFARLLQDHTVLFAGRDTVVASIDRFLHERPAGYLVVSAPPGYGKTALMAHLIRGGGDAYAYHFFAPIYAQDSMREAFFLRSVVEQMAAWHADHRPLPTESDLPELRALFQTYLDRAAPGTRVLVLDDVDEVVGWELTPYLGGRLPDGLHVILTTREPGGSLDYARISLPFDQTDFLQLEGLRQNEVRDVLVAAGGQAAALAGRPDVIAEIVRIAVLDSDAEGRADPLYLRFLVEDLRDQRLSPASLAERPRGLNGYFQAWYATVLHAHGTEALRGLCATLVCARGPLHRDDLQRLHPDLAGRWLNGDLDQVLASGRRFFTNDAAGRYAIAHPRLKEYLRERIHADDPRLLAGAEQRLLSLCQWWREQPSDYALRFYSRHLLETSLGGTPSADSARSQLFALVDDEAWYVAHLSDDPSGAGYLADVACAWQAAAAVDNRATQRDASAPLLDRELWCVLSSASLRSLSSNIPIPLLSRLATLHPTPALPPAIGIALQIPDPAARCEALTTVADSAPEPLRDAALAHALAAAEAIVDDDAQQALAFARLAVIDPPRFGQLVRRALDLGRGLPTSQRVRVLAALASALEESERLRAFREALDQVEQLGRVEQKARALIDLAPGLPAALAERALQVGLALDSEMWTAQALAAVAPRLTAAQLRQLGAFAHRIRNPGWRAHLIQALALQSTGPDRDEQVQAGVAAAQLISDPSWRARALATLADVLPSDQAIDLLDHARAAIRPRTVTDDEQLARTLVVVASHTPSSARRIASLEAWQSARAVENPRARAELATEVARLVPTDEREVMIDEVFSALDAVPVTRWRERNQMIGDLAPLLGPDRLVRAMAVARAIGDGSEQVRAIAALCTAVEAPDRDDMLRAAAGIARALQSPRARAAATVSLLPVLESSEREWAVGDVLSATVRVAGDEMRAEAIAGIAGYLPGAAVPRALEIAARLDNEGSRAQAICALVPHVAAPLLPHALTIARTIVRRGWRADALACVASRLSGVPRTECLSEIRALAQAATSSEWRFRALLALARADDEAGDAIADQALSAARESANAAWRVRALASLVPWISVDRRDEVIRTALADARQIASAEARGRALVSMVGLVDALRRVGLLDEIVPVVAGLQAWQRRSRLFSLLAPELARLPRIQSYPIFKRTLRTVGARTRREVLLDLAALAPVVRAIGGDSASLATARYILEVARRWP